MGPTDISQINCVVIAQFRSWINPIGHHRNTRPGSFAEPARLLGAEELDPSSCTAAGSWNPALELRVSGAALAGSRAPFAAAGFCPPGIAGAANASSVLARGRVTFKAPFQLQNCGFSLPTVESKRLYFLLCQEPTRLPYAPASLSRRSILCLAGPAASLGAAAQGWSVRDARGGPRRFVALEQLPCVPELGLVGLALRGPGCQTQPQRGAKRAARPRGLRPSPALFPRPHSTGLALLNQR